MKSNEMSKELAKIVNKKKKLIRSREMASQTIRKDILQN